MGIIANALLLRCNCLKLLVAPAQLRLALEHLL